MRTGDCVEKSAFWSGWSKFPFVSAGFGRQRVLKVVIIWKTICIAFTKTLTHIYQHFTLGKIRLNPHVQMPKTTTSIYHPRWVCFDTICIHTHTAAVLPSLSCQSLDWTQVPAVHSDVTPVGKERWTEHQNIPQWEQRNEITAVCERKRKHLSVCGHDEVTE